MNEPSGTLRGKAAVRAYWAKGLALPPTIKFELLADHAGVNRLGLVYRSVGLGTLLLHRLQNEARQLKRPLRLQVIRFSRAVNLFERMGFVRTSETGTHFQMEWRPPR